ncbi:MAG: helix-turn-helix domain-containing protein [Pseudomonadota bacterium]|nr:helix-turn-helix domain-containing protein [Pseudomonadota bacterium]
MTQSHHDLGEARPRGEKDTIRSLSRSIHVIQAINRYGSLGLSEIAKAANVPMPTAFRIINTLIEEGLVERERERRKYRPTALIQTLACGFQNHDRLVNAARTVMSDFTHLHHWPLSIVTRVGNRMVVRYHTAAQTTLTYNNYYPGWQVPILASASGQVYVAYTDELTRARLIDSAAELEEAYGQYMLEQFQSGAATRRIRADGYATVEKSWYSANPGKTSAVAVPIFDGEELIGALAVVFFAAGLSVDAAVERYLAPIQEVSRTIRANLAAGGIPGAVGD